MAENLQQLCRIDFSFDPLRTRLTQCRKWNKTPDWGGEKPHTVLSPSILTLRHELLLTALFKRNYQ